MNPTAAHNGRGEAGFSLLELLVATAVMTVVVGVGMSAMLRVTNSQQTIWNRTEMHSAVRSATELLQQEVGQAGRVAPLVGVTLAGNVGAGPQTVGVVSASGTPTAAMFVGEKVIIDTNISQETVSLTGVNAANNQISAVFTNAHAAGAAVSVTGGFAAGIVPPGGANGSTGAVLKLFGDINSDGNMVYIEYMCDTAGGNLYRNAMPWTAATKPPPDPSMILMRNITANPGDAPCFTYQTQVTLGMTYVIDVAITLTVRTQQKDSVTKQYQNETKALLNVSPRNIFNVWELASSTPPLLNRVQPMPLTVQNLLP